MDQKKNRSHPINRAIRFPEVRVIDSDNSHMGIMPTSEALALAQEKELDLVMINDKAEPPVCRIVDYGKFKYEQEKQEKKAEKNQHKVSVKELKMRYTIEEHDYQVRINQAERFLKAGDKVKATIKFRGRESQHSHLAESLLNKMATDLQEFGEMQQAPKKEGNNMTMLLSPKSTTVKLTKGKQAEPENVEAKV